MVRKIVSFGLAVISTLGFASCDNLMEPSMPHEKGTINLVKATEIYVSSNNSDFTSTRGGSEPTFTKWQWNTEIEGWPETTDRGEQVSSTEKDYVMKYLAEHRNEGYTECDVMPYFLQNVGGNGDVYHLSFMNGDTEHHSTDINGTSQMDYFELNGVHVNDFNSSYGNRIYVENLPLTNPRYRDSYANLIQENHYRFYYIPNENGEGYSLYLCFDYATSKYDNGQLDFEGDRVFNDWVIKIVPADGKAVVPPSENGNDAENKDDSDKPTLNASTEHVEINLSIEERKGVEWLASHLSIHVRANTDVEVFIPLPMQYYCATDDMAIVQKHVGDLTVHGGPKEVTYNIGGYDVTLTVAFENDGIRVATKGVCEEVIDYCQKTYGDGITFEVWNYMNIKVKDWDLNADVLGFGQENEITVEELRKCLNKSQVWFTNNPSLYVNAFNFTEDGSKFADDCTVTPQDYPNHRETNYWHNGSPYNELYYKD